MLAKEAARRVRGEPPVPAVAPTEFVIAHRAQAREGGQHNTPRLEDALQVFHDSARVENELERLREDDAIEAAVRNRAVVLRKVCDEGRALRAGFVGEHVHARDMFAPEAGRVTRITNFEDVPANVGAVSGEESIDVIPVDGLAPVHSPNLADRRGTAQVAEIDPPKRRVHAAARAHHAPDEAPSAAKKGQKKHGWIERTASRRCSRSNDIGCPLHGTTRSSARRNEAGSTTTSALRPREGQRPATALQ